VAPRRLPQIVQHNPFGRVKQNRYVLHVAKLKSSLLTFILDRADAINHTKKSKDRAIRSVQDDRRQNSLLVVIQGAIPLRPIHQIFGRPPARRPLQYTLITSEAAPSRTTTRSKSTNCRLTASWRMEFGAFVKFSGGFFRNGDRKMLGAGLSSFTPCY